MLIIKELQLLSIKVRRNIFFIKINRIKLILQRKVYNGNEENPFLFEIWNYCSVKRVARDIKTIE